MTNHKRKSRKNKSGNKWQEAQTREMESWLETDMTSNRLLSGWRDRIGDFRRVIRRCVPGSAILDVGSGPISVLHTFPRVRRMVAIDPLNDRYVSKYERLDYIEYISRKAEVLKFPDGSFDTVLCVNALDHMDRYLDALGEMVRVLKSGGMLYLEYENSSPLTVLLAKMGYRKPLDDFHPILVRNKQVLTLLRRARFKIVEVRCRPQFSFKKVTAIFRILLGRQHMSTYEQTISSTNYGMIRMLVHYSVIFLERVAFLFAPRSFGYFTVVIAVKR